MIGNKKVILLAGREAKKEYAMAIMNFKKITIIIFHKEKGGGDGRWTSSPPEFVKPCPLRKG